MGSPGSGLEIHPTHAQPTWPTILGGDYLSGGGQLTSA
jgi:hypothetical protein